MIIHIGLPRAASTSIAEFHARQGFRVVNAGISDIILAPIKADFVKGESISDSVLCDEPDLWRQCLYTPGAEPPYKVDPERCAGIVKGFYPKAKILLVERNYPQWLQSVFHYCARSMPYGRRTFEDWLETPSGKTHVRIMSGNLLEIYSKLFPTCMLQYEDITQDPSGFMTKLCAFTGATPGQLPRRNRSHWWARWIP